MSIVQNTQCDVCHRNCNPVDSVTMRNNTRVHHRCFGSREVIDLRDRLTLLFGGLEWRIDRVSRNPAVVNAAYAAFFGTAAVAVGSAVAGEVGAVAGAATATVAGVVLSIASELGVARGAAALAMARAGAVTGAAAAVALALAGGGAVTGGAAAVAGLGTVVAGAVAAGGVHWILQKSGIDQDARESIGLRMYMGGVSATFVALNSMGSSASPIVLLIPLIANLASLALSR